MASLRLTTGYSVGSLEGHHGARRSLNYMRIEYAWRSKRSSGIPLLCAQTGVPGRTTLGPRHSLGTRSKLHPTFGLTTRVRGWLLFSAALRTTPTNKTTTGLKY